LNWLIYAGWAGLAMGLVWLITPVVRALALAIGAVDLPEARKVHQGVMPRLGGLGIFLVFAAVSVPAAGISRELLGILAGSGLIVLVGMVDDVRGLSPKVKLAGQVGAALVLVSFGVRVDFITNPLNGMLVLGNLAVPVTVLWVVGVTNALNLIDGLDGLAAGTAAVAALTMAVIAGLEGQALALSLGLVLAGACVGFLRYNFHPARIFMGDTGSMFLGFTLAALSITGFTKSATVISVVLPVVILGLPLLDTGFAIVRRYLGHKPIFEADKEHLHHRLLALGLSHRATVLVIYAINLVLGASAVLLTRLTGDQAVLVLVGLSVVILAAANRLGILEVKRRRSMAPAEEKARL